MFGNGYDFLQFIKDFKYEYFMKLNCAIIPNMNSDFVLLNSNLGLSKDVPENMIECMENLGIKWKEEHLHKNLMKFRIGIEHNIKDAVPKILECVNEWSDKVLFLMQYIPEDNNSKFQQKREIIYELCSIIFKDKKFQKRNGTKFPEKIWENVDIMIINKIIEKIGKYGHICDECSIEFINKFLYLLIIYYRNYLNYAIIPNKNGRFCQINNLYKEDNIPDIFKECLKKCFNCDINEELIDDRINYVNSLKMKNIYDYSNSINLYFRNNENNNEKIYINIKAAEYLIRIIPKKSDNQIFEDQRKLFFIYIFFKHINCNYCEININKSNDNNLWLYSNKYIYDIIKEIIENHENIDSLAESLEQNKESIIENLKEFIKFSNSGKIILNQNGIFCENNELSNEKDWGNGSVKLKEIAFYLDYDVREELSHESMGNPCLKDMSYKDICNKIDEMMSSKFKDINNHQNKNYKNAAKKLLEYFDEIGERKVEEYFHCTFSIKERIAYNVIYDEKTRKYFSELDKTFGINNLSELSKNEDIQKIVKILLNKKRSRSSLNDLNVSIKELFKDEKNINQNIKLEEKFENEETSKLLNNPDKEKFLSDLIKDEEFYNIFSKYNINSIKKLLKNPKKLNRILNGEFSDDSYNISSKIKNEDEIFNISFNSEITNNKPLLDFYIDSLPQFLEYADDFDFGSSNHNKIIGTSGETYIYELLSNSWNMLDNTGHGEDFEYNGKYYKIHNDFSHYDILVETFDGRKIYVEVKSTNNNFNKRVPFYLGKKQIKTMEQTELPNEYALAIVFEVMGQPKHFFMTLRKNI